MNNRSNNIIQLPKKITIIFADGCSEWSIKNSVMALKNGERGSFIEKQK